MSFAASSRSSLFQEAEIVAPFHNRPIYPASLLHVSKLPTGQFYFMLGLQGKVSSSWVREQVPPDAVGPERRIGYG